MKDTEAVCVRPERDEKGRLLPGHTANPRGRPSVSKYAKLFRAAAELGVAVLILPGVKAAADKPAELPKVLA